MTVASPVEPPQVLVVEDSDEDFDTVHQSYLRSGRAGELARAATGEDCLDMLAGFASAGQLPRLVLLDLNTPGEDGRDALRAIKSHPEWRDLPVVVLTTSSNPRDLASCEEFGANGYYVKPFNFLEHLALVERILSRWLDQPTPDLQKDKRT